MLFIWPAAVAWSWGNGWLYDVMDQSMIDYGGSVTIYSFAGAFGFVGTLFTGRRPERYANEAKFSIINVEIYVLGAFLTILGVFGMGWAQQSGHGVIAMANLWICGAVSSIMALKLLTIYNKEMTIHYIAIYQGFIAGMVFIASSAGNTRPWVSGLHGLMSGGVFWFGIMAEKWLKIDDPANITATFLIPGIFGGVLPGFIDDLYGVYFAGWESGQTLGTNVVGTGIITLWSAFWAVVIFGILSLVGALKLNHDDTLEGTVITQRGFVKGSAIRDSE